MPFGTEKAALLGSGAGAPASGGTETTYDDGGNTYIVHTFTEDGTLIIGGADLDVDYIIQAGGANGAGGYSAGGGAGGQVEGASITLSASTSYPVVAGVFQSTGLDSTFNGDTAVGGGGADAPGGCGGGRNHQYKVWSKPATSSTQPSTQPSGATGYGSGGGSNSGGSGCGPGQGYGAAGGGGGTQGGGDNGSGCASGGAGGSARQNAYRTSEQAYYGGGGGGGNIYSNPGGAGGSGIGGAGTGATTGSAGNATSQTGSGGGGGGGIGLGSDGIVIVRYIEP